MNGNIIEQQELKTKSWPFASFVSAGVATQYAGGFYLFGASNFTPAAAQALGTANISYAAHAFIVLGAASTDMVVRITGTSIDDLGTRTPGDTQDLDTSGGSTNDYYETTKKWLGAVDIKLQSGTGVTVNYGLCKYWDYNNTGFIVKGLEVTGMAGANDATPQIELLHHEPTGWTYNAGSTPTPPSHIADLQTDHNTEFQLKLKEPFAWKRSNIDHFIHGSANEGIMFSIDINSNNSISFADLNITFVASPTGQIV